MSKIIDNKLYLGNIFDSINEKLLQEFNIDTIICLAEGLKIVNTDQNVSIFQYDLQDTHDCNMSVYFDEITDLIHKQNSVLVNCTAGISRLATMVIAYIMKYYKLNLHP